ncbi:TIR domain-containing protein [Rhodoferax sp.]|uniref:TIR domain-containing protein n=1 Tax=Rhodoferax sp. TaxID=50421 RepID=UPI0026112380|nr:TIR domain-containing protein [Rhodoferax sp.]MDD2810259.1 nucleotide-binding protein [Rhodoferax sp.]
MKKRLFIGSSTEALALAYSLQENLEHVAEVTVWTQDIFKPSSYTLDDLEEALDAFDYGVFVFSPDDITKIRSEEFRTVRDNVLFEFGLFIGRLGRENCFFVAPRSAEGLHLPTDLLGLSPLTYDPTRTDDNLNAALGPACNKIRKEISSGLADAITSARTQYDILNNRFPTRRSLRYLDTACIFHDRTAFDACVGYQRLFASAKSIKGMGVSLNAITINWGVKDLFSLIATQHCSVALLFLDPGAKATKWREEVEELPKKTISNVTDTNLALARKVRSQCNASGIDLFQYRLYSTFPFLNMYVIDDRFLIFQHYMLGRRGQESPVFVLRNEGRDVGLFTTYLKCFDETWVNAKEDSNG